MSQRLANTRSGDLAEGMGIEMLRSIALVAPVPQPEDVGVDAFATLLKPRERHTLPAAPEYVLEDLLRAMINIGIAGRSEIKSLEPLRVGKHILPQGFFEVMRENRIALTPRISFRSKSKLE